MNKVKFISFTAGLVLAMAFTFSCSSDDGGGGESSPSVGDGGSSSSGGTQGSVSSSSYGNSDISSSSVGGGENSYSYCLLSGERLCLDGPFTSKDCATAGGSPSNSCPYGGVEPSSSSGEAESSSSVAPSSSSSGKQGISSSETASSSSEVESSSSVPPSSSSVVPSSSSALPSSSGVAISSSSDEPSSSSAHSSSSSITPSSSSAPTFACTITAATERRAGMVISPAPAVTCNGSTVTADLTWTPADLTPTAAGSVSISVSASSGVCSSMVAQCGSIYVTPPTFACTMAATTGRVGVAISPVPVATCNGNTVTADLTWTPADLIPTAESAVPVNVSANSGFCSGMAFRCGSITVSPPFTYESLLYEGQSYKTIKIGTQRWMAENLNYAVSGSKCNRNDPANCDTYGSLYNWSTAMALPSSCNSTSCSSQIQSPHRGICPSGWHIPSNEDWGKLFRYVGSTTVPNGIDGYIGRTAGKYLKATRGWSEYQEIYGTDEYGFSALPGGGGYSDGSFSSVDFNGLWWGWSASGNNACYLNIFYQGDGVNLLCGGSVSSSSLYSIRCLQDEDLQD